MTMLAEVVDAVIGIDTHRDSHEVEIADPSKTGGMAAVMVQPVDVPPAIHATSASVPMRHVLPSLALLTMPPA
jgi:hypothetical protein